MTNPRWPFISNLRKWTVAICAVLSLSLLAVPAAAGPRNEAAPSFDLDKGNAVTEVIFPALQQAQGATISADGSDVTFIVDHAMLLELAWFDAIAPFHAKAVGIYSNLGRRPASENTNRNKNTAVFPVQNFVPPHSGASKPIPYDPPSRSALPPPRDSDHHRLAAYRRQAD